jgi:hypothetical protein
MEDNLNLLTTKLFENFDGTLLPMKFYQKLEWVKYLRKQEMKGKKQMFMKAPSKQKANG